MEVSVVIPVFRDRAVLTDLLGSLRALEPPPMEIIVVDGGGGDGDGIEALCASAGCRYLVSRPCRGEQMHCGALAARGDALWFLHADAGPHSQSIAAIRAHLGQGALGGWFRFAFRNEDCWQALMLAYLINLRASVGVPYGDQGLFMLCEAYRRAGGFPPRALFEEPPLVKRLRRMGRFRPIKTGLGVASRRWRRDGWFRRSLANRRLALAYMLGFSPEYLARRYFQKR